VFAQEHQTTYNCYTVLTTSSAFVNKWGDDDIMQSVRYSRRHLVEQVRNSRVNLL